MQLAEIVRRRQEITAETERLGVERARLLTDNIELDRRAGDLVEEIRLAEETVTRLATQ
jgi:chromosome segregation protein